MLFGGFVESRPKDFKEEIDEEEYAEDYGYLSDSDLEDDEGRNTFPKDTNKSRVRSSGSADVTYEERIICEDENHEERVEKGKVVKISDMAFVT